MPSLGADMTAGTLLEWHVKPGDRVHRGDIVAVVDTSKAEIEIEIFEDGVVGELLVPVGAKVPVGTVLATVSGNGAEPPPPPPAPAPSRPRVSPLARRVAETLGVDLAAVAGTGPGGAITREDVERAGGAAAPPAPAAPAPAAADRGAAMRQAIGELMARSKREIPHYHLETHVDLSEALAWLSDHNAELAPAARVIPAALLLAASARAVRATPALNGFFRDGKPAPADHVHLGVALALRGGGLVAPAIHDADTLGIDALMAALRDLATRARAGSMRGSEMADPTITVTNLGDRGADKVLGVIYPPQVALVGFGAIRERPWAKDGMVGARRTAIATLAADHRVSDGHEGGLLLAEIDRLLQSPQELT